MKQRWLFLGIGSVVLIAILTGAFLLLRPRGDRITADRPILFAMDFENEAAFFGWHVGGPGSDYLWLKNVKNGKYYFEFPSGFLENQDFDFSDIQISADVEFLGKQRMDASVACRMQPGATGRYFFIISNDQRWKITKWYKGSDETLAEGWSDEIRLDKNRLSGRCVGAQLTLLVNGVELGTARDKDMSTGSLNLGYNSEQAGSGTFDNLVVEDWSGE